MDTTSRKRPPGRPPLPAHLQKSHYVGFRLTDEQLTELDVFARRFKIGRSAVLRRLIQEHLCDNNPAAEADGGAATDPQEAPWLPHPS